MIPQAGPNSSLIYADNKLIDKKNELLLHNAYELL